MTLQSRGINADPIRFSRSNVIWRFATQESRIIKQLKALGIESVKEKAARGEKSKEEKDNDERVRKLIMSFLTPNLKNSSTLAYCGTCRSIISNFGIYTEERSGSSEQMTSSISTWVGLDENNFELLKGYLDGKYAKRTNPKNSKAAKG
jgi:hypothetical protein